MLTQVAIMKELVIYVEKEDLEIRFNLFVQTVKEAFPVVDALFVEGHFNLIIYSIDIYIVQI